MSSESSFAKLVQVLQRYANVPPAEARALVEAFDEARSEDGRTIYVDPVNGNDSQDGSAAAPIKTLLEATRRVPLSAAAGMSVELLAGTHTLADVSALSDRTIFRAMSGVTIRGASSVAQVLTVASKAANVLTVDETLVADALIGKFIMPTPTTYRWIIDNDETTITLAATTTELGGAVVLPATGALNVYQLDTTIKSAATNPGLVANRFYFDGAPIFEKLIFDANGGFAGPSSWSPSTFATFTACKWTGAWSQATNCAGDSTLAACMFDRGGVVAGYAHGVGINGKSLVTQDCVFKDYQTGVMASPGSVLTIGATYAAWALALDRYVESDGAIVQDFSTRWWIDGGLSAFVIADGRGAQYMKANVAIVGATGHKSATRAFESREGSATFHLFDATALDLTLATALALMEGVEVPLADYLAGNAPASAARRFSDDLGNRIYF